MPRTLLRQIVRFVAAPPGVSVLPHGINLDGVAQAPDLVIGVSVGHITLAVNAANVTLTNGGAAAVDADVYLFLDHTLDRAYGADSQMITGMVPRPFIVIASPAGGGAGGAEQVFRYIATGGEGSDFPIPLPAARANDFYAVTIQQAGMTANLGVDAPDILPGDRTTLLFRCVTSAAVAAGDQFDIRVISF